MKTTHYLDDAQEIRRYVSDLMRDLTERYPDLANRQGRLGEARSWAQYQDMDVNDVGEIEKAPSFSFNPGIDIDKLYVTDRAKELAHEFLDKGRIPFKENYAAPGGAELYEKLHTSSAEGGPYPFFRHEMSAMESISFAGSQYIGIGDGLGQKPIESFKINGHPERCEIVDYSKYYSSHCRDNFIRSGQNPDTISEYNDDYESDHFLNVTLEEIKQKGRLPNGEVLFQNFGVFGNMVNNASFPNTLKALRKKLVVNQAALFIGACSTLDAPSLRFFYGDDAMVGFTRNGTAHVVGKEIAWSGLDVTRLPWAQEATVRGDRGRTHFRLMNVVAQELTLRHIEGVTNASVVEDLERKGLNKVILRPWTYINHDYSDRYSRPAYIEMFKKAGFRAVYPGLMGADKPLPVNYKFLPKDYKLANHIYRIVPV